jgi:HlyD family secretion protein
MLIGNPRDAIGLALVAALAAGVAGCERPSPATTGRGDAKAAPPVTRVEVVRPERQTIRRTVEEPGQVEAFEVTPVHAKVAGYVRTWNVNIGSKVTKGQVLAELDVPEAEAEADQKRAMVAQAEARRAQAEAAVEVAQADVAAAEARLAEARAGIRRAGADLERWQAEYKRVEHLFRERAQTGSLLDETRNKLRSSEAARDEADAQVTTARAAVTQGRAALDKARADVAAAASGIQVAQADARRSEALLGYTRIVAPFDGVVIRRHVDTGDLTVPGPQGDPLFVVARSDVVFVAVAVPELFAASVGPGDRATVRLQALPGRSIEGKVTRTAYALDAHSRTLRAEIDLPNPDGALHPGLYAYTSIVADEHPDALTLPSTAVIREGGKAFCAAVRQGRVARLPIEVGLSDGTRTEVLSGLDEGEVVVKANAASLADGQPVEPIEPASPPAPSPKP